MKKIRNANLEILETGTTKDTNHTKKATPARAAQNWAMMFNNFGCRHFGERTLFRDGRFRHWLFGSVLDSKLGFGESPGCATNDEKFVILRKFMLCLLER